MEELPGLTVSQVKIPGWSPLKTVHPNESRFPILFRPILHDLAAFSWTEIPYVKPRDPGDPELDAIVSTLVRGHYVPPNTLMPAFCKYLLGDWCDFYGYLTRPYGTPDDNLPYDRQSQTISPLVDIAFHNIDGAYWTIHTRLDRLLTAMQTFGSKNDWLNVSETDSIRVAAA